MSKLVSEGELIKFLSEDLSSNEEIFIKLLGHLSKHLEDLRNAQNNLELKKALVHKAKSGCSTFGATQLHLKLLELESYLNSNNTLKQTELYQIVLDLTEPSLNEVKMISNQYFKRTNQSA